MIDATPEVDDGLELPLFSLEDREDLFARWRLDAACRGGLPTDWFYPERGGGGSDHVGNRAKAVCSGCPVREECLASALRRREPAGVWGGAGEARRRAIARAAKKGPQALAPLLAAHWRAVDDCPEEGDVELLASFGAGARHGRRSTQAKGCRCAACVWAASSPAQALTRLGVDSAEFWDEWVAGADDAARVASVDGAAREVFVDVVAALMSLGWRRITVAEGQAVSASEPGRVRWSMSGLGRSVAGFGRPASAWWGEWTEGVPLEEQGAVAEERSFELVVAVAAAVTSLGPCPASPESLHPLAWRILEMRRSKGLRASGAESDIRVTVAA
jgi:WhiB family redox-sensing transcriptional regulator